MPTFCRTFWPAVLLAVILAGCSGQAVPLAPMPSPTSPTQTATPVVPAFSPTTAPTPSPVGKPAAVDTTPPTVSLATDLAEVPWQGQTTIHVTAQDDRGVVGLVALLDNQVLATAGAGDLSFDLIPGALDGVTPGSAYTITARATDAAGNVGLATLAVIFGPAPETPAPANVAASPAGSSSPQSGTLLPDVSSGTPMPPATARPVPSSTVTLPASVTSYRVVEINLPTYPYAPFLRPASDPALGGYPVTTLDRAAYERSNPQPSPATYRMIVLENRYLRLGILPDLGGRIYECTFKPTGNNEFYSNPVVKPTNWGPPSPPYPAGANWWLGVGGLEWGFPVEEHGYEWGTRWGFDHVTQANGGVMVTVFTRGGPQFPYAVVDIILPPDTAYFVVQPHIINPWGGPFKFKWWEDAMLAPGAANKPGADLRFIFPASEVTVHSSGAADLPGPGQPMAWPVTNGRDLSRLGNWTGYLGVFQRPAAHGQPGPSGAEGFMGAYDAAADEGMLRIYPSDVARGAMVFAPGWSDPLDAKLWTDDGSGFVALRGGMTPTVVDWYELAPGAEIAWSEIWYPVAGISGVTYAAESGAIHLLPGGIGLRVGVFPTVAVQGQVTVSLPGMEPVMWPVAVGPDKPFNQQIPYTANMPDRGKVALTLTDSEDLVVLTYQAEVQLR